MKGPAFLFFFRNILKNIVLALFLLFPVGVSHAAVTSKHFSACQANPQIQLIVQVTDYKAQGLSKEYLLKTLKEADLPKEDKTLIARVIAYVYDQKHEVSAPISAFVNCLNQSEKADSTVI